MPHQEGHRQRRWHILDLGCRSGKPMGALADPPFHRRRRIKRDGDPGAHRPPCMRDIPTAIDSCQVKRRQLLSRRTSSLVTEATKAPTTVQCRWDESTRRRGRSRWSSSRKEGRRMQVATEDPSSIRRRGRTCVAGHPIIHPPHPAHELKTVKSQWHSCCRDELKRWPCSIHARGRCQQTIRDPGRRSD